MPGCVPIEESRFSTFRIASADRVDLLISFLKFSGWRLLRDDIRRFLERRLGGLGLRVLATTY